MPAAASRLRVHHILPASQANGPGWRAVVWLQGCTLACPGCFNPGTHAKSGGEWLEVEELCRLVFPISSVHILPEDQDEEPLPGPPLKGREVNQICSLPRASRFRREVRGGPGRGSSSCHTLQKAREEDSPSIEGITISGGEPLQQMAGLISFLTRIRAETHLSVILFSGYTWTEIQAMPQAERLLSLVDVLLAGRYVAEQRVAHGLLGSGNKTIHFLSNRYTAADLEAVPEAEVILTQNGEIIYSGINPLQDQDTPSGGGSTGS